MKKKKKLLLSLDKKKVSSLNRSSQRQVHGGVMTNSCPGLCMTEAYGCAPSTDCTSANQCASDPGC